MALQTVQDTLNAYATRIQAAAGTIGTWPTDSISFSNLDSAVTALEAAVTKGTPVIQGVTPAPTV